MERATVLTCALTGNLTRPEQTPHLPLSPKQLIESALEAAEAGAAAVHIHVRNPVTGAPSMDVSLYAEVVEGLRRHRPELIINLTTGPGQRFIPSDDDPKVAGPGTTLLPPLRRVEHITALKPDVCSLDLNTMNSGDQVVINTPKTLRVMAAVLRAVGCVPELECFDTGDLILAKTLIADGTLAGPGLYSFVMGVNYSLPFTPDAMIFAKSLVPAAANWSAFAIGRNGFRSVAQAFLLGGNVRIGLEDTIYLERGKLARSNAELVTKARRIVEDLGGRLATSAETRTYWGLRASNAA